MKKSFSKLKAVLFGLFLGLLLCEILLRIYNPFPFALQKGRLILPANQHKVFVNRWISKLDRHIRYSRNSLGFRGPEPPDSLWRLLSIVTVGGSTTECKFLSDSCTWPSRLDELLRPGHPDLWINNAGMDGHSTYGHLLLLREYLVRLRPRYILFLTGINDVETDRPDEFDLMNDNRLNTHSVKSFLKSLLNHTELGRTAFHFYLVEQAYKKGLIHREVRPGDLRVEPLADSIVQARLAAQKPYLAGYRARVDSLISLCRQAGIQPIFITQPSLYGDYTDPVSGLAMGDRWLRDDPRPNNCRLEGLVLDQYNAVLRSLAPAVPVIDLAARMPKNPAYYYDFIHFTNEGAREVASLLADQLRPLIFTNPAP
ncbi:MAG TPA: SGNH/GDSL hydrolase family protein [Chitinophagaceae bacterium]|nr:SGNH/GDSL hydrolase family protein [Chitinophagaceae bacterium]